MANNPISKYERMHPKSKELLQEASDLAPGGLPANGQKIKPFPIFFTKGKGNKLWDADGNGYIDFHCGYGPLMLGHSHPTILDAIDELKEKGFHYGFPNIWFNKLAKKIQQYTPCAELVRFTNSGSEAVHYAIRLARGYTGKDKICKIDGGYHGTGGPQFNFAGAGPTEQPQSIRTSAGIPDFQADNTILIPGHDVSHAARIIEENADELACVIVEPVSGTGSGLTAPDKEYLQALREITRAEDVLLIFDEIMVGFRIGDIQGPEKYFDVTPDLVTLGKVIGGGAPIGCFAGKREIMEKVSPMQSKDRTETVYHSGTFNSNPYTVKVALAAFEEYEKKGTYKRADRMGEKMREGLNKLVKEMDLNAQVTGLFSIWMLYFYKDEPFDNFESFAAQHDKEKTYQLDLELINRGIMQLPTHFNFTNMIHTEEEVDKCLEAYRKALEQVA